MNEQGAEKKQLRTPEMFALAVASTAGRSVYDNVPVYPKVVAPTGLDRASSSSSKAFKSGTLADAVNKLVGRPSFNVPASGIMGIMSNRTVANQGFAA